MHINQNIIEGKLLENISPQKLAPSLLAFSVCNGHFNHFRVLSASHARPKRVPRSLRSARPITSKQSFLNECNVHSTVPSLPATVDLLFWLEGRSRDRSGGLSVPARGNGGVRLDLRQQQSGLCLCNGRRFLADFRWNLLDANSSVVWVWCLCNFFLDFHRFLKWIGRRDLFFSSI